MARSTPAATARAIGEPIPELRELRPQLPLPLCETIDACLVADPGERPPIAELGAELRHALPELHADRAVPGRMGSALLPARPSLEWLVRLMLLLAVAGSVAWLGAIAGRPGAALVVAVLLVPVPVLLARPVHWGLPALAPPLGLVGAAPLFPALASLASTPTRRFALAWLGFAWLAVAEAQLGTTLLFGTLESPPAGWTTSADQAASAVLLPLLSPPALLAAAVWGAAAVVLGELLRGRMIALELLGVLVWTAGLVATHRLLAGAEAAPAAAPLAIGAVCVALLALWLRAARGALEAGRASRGLA